MLLLERRDDYLVWVIGPSGLEMITARLLRPSFPIFLCVDRRPDYPLDEALAVGRCLNSPRPISLVLETMAVLLVAYGAAEAFLTCLNHVLHGRGWRL